MAGKHRIRSLIIQEGLPGSLRRVLRQMRYTTISLPVCHSDVENSRSKPDRVPKVGQERWDSREFQGLSSQSRGQWGRKTVSECPSGTPRGPQWGTKLVDPGCVSSPGWPHPHPPSGRSRRYRGKLDSGFWVGEWVPWSLAGGEAWGGSRGAGGQQWGAAGEWLKCCCRHLAVRTLALAGLAREDLCHELEDHPGRCDPNSVQQILPQLPLLCSGHHARWRTSNELGSFSWCSRKYWLCRETGGEILFDLSLMPDH